MNPSLKWQRQSPVLIWIYLTEQVIESLKAFWPVLLLWFFQKENEQHSFSTKVIFGGLAIVLIGAILSLIRYWQTAYAISEHYIHVRETWWKRKETIIPREKIADILIGQGFWQQVFEVASLRIETAGTSNAEVHFKALRLADAQQLKQELLHSATTSTTIAPNLEIPLFKVQNAALFKLGLSANHFVTFFILLGAGIQLIDDLQRLVKRKLFDEIQQVSALSSMYAIMGVVCIAALITIIFSVIRTVNKYFDFTIWKQPNGLRLQYGLLKKEQRAIPFKRWQTLFIKHNKLAKWLGIWWVEVRSTGYDITGKNNPPDIPVIAMDQLSTWIYNYQSTPIIAPTGGQSVHSDYWRFPLLYYYLPFVLLSGVAWWLAVPFWIVAGWVAICISLAIHRYLRWKTIRYSISPEGIQLLGGWWQNKHQLLRWENVQWVRVKQSRYQQKKNLATLEIIAAGAICSVPYLPLTTAQQLANEMVYWVETKYKHWQ